jgi:hypothetical protein
VDYKINRVYPEIKATSRDSKARSIKKGMKNPEKAKKGLFSGSNFVLRPQDNPILFCSYNFSAPIWGTAMTA